MVNPVGVYSGLCGKSCPINVFISRRIAGMECVGASLQGLVIHGLASFFGSSSAVAQQGHPRHGSASKQMGDALEKLLINTPIRRDAKGLSESLTNRRSWTSLTLLSCDVFDSIFRVCRHASDMFSPTNPHKGRKRNCPIKQHANACIDVRAAPAEVNSQLDAVPTPRGSSRAASGLVFMRV